MDAVNPENPQGNLELAMKVAEEFFGLER